jgi:methyltransferase-like protein
MPEIGLAIGRERGTHKGITREWLYWYDENSNRCLTFEELANERQQQLQELLAKLQERGIDPDTL